MAHPVTGHMTPLARNVKVTVTTAMFCKFLPKIASHVVLLILPIALRPFQFGLGLPYNWYPFLSNPMLSFSIVSHQASLNRLPHRLSTSVWVVLYIFFLLISLERSSLQTWSRSF